MTLRVAYLLTRYPQLSETFVSNEISHLRAQGVEVLVVALEPGSAGTDPDTLYVDDISRSGRRSAFEHARWAARHPVRYARFRRAVRLLSSEMTVGAARNKVRWRRLPHVADRLLDQGVTVLHAHFGWSGAAAALLLSELTGLPWSVTLHANDIFSRRRNLELKLARADRVVTVCEYNATWLREREGFSRPLDLVVCGVDVPPLPAAGSTADVVSVGRLVRKKGFDVLLDAVGLLAGQGRQVALELVGEGPLRLELEAQAQRLGVAGSVCFRGALPHPQVLDAIAGGRVFALAARVADDGDRDSMPVVIKEAMARAVPVVATDVVAIPEMVDDRTGRLVPPDDPSRLADALRELLDDDGLRAELGRAGRARVEERFTLSGEVAKLRVVLEELSTQR